MDYTVNKGITVRLNESYESIMCEFEGIYDVGSIKNDLNSIRSNSSAFFQELMRLQMKLKAAGIQFDKTQSDLQYYRDLVDNLPKVDNDEFEKRLMRVIFRMYKDFPEPTKYLQRMVDRLSSPDDSGWANDPLRLRILKQFIKYGGSFTTAGLGGVSAIKKYVRTKLGVNPKKTLSGAQIADNLDDGVFDLLGTLDSADILEIPNNLAAGRFLTNGSTERALYLFAMVYGMTYCTDDSSHRIPDTDIEKNLFTDFYTNNLVRFFSEDLSYNTGAERIDPPCRGINYKNFAEVVCLYYIAKSELSAAEKMKGAFSMIDRLSKKAKGKKPQLPDSGSRTIIYREIARKGPDRNGSNIFEYNEEQFEQVISEYYNCDTSGGSPFYVEPEQRTAYKVYMELYSELKEKTKELYGKRAEISCDYGLYLWDFERMRKNPKKVYEKYKNYLITDRDSSDERYESVDEEEFEGLARVLYKMNEFMIMKEKDIGDIDGKKVTRTRLLVLFYYYYNLVAEAEKDDISDENETSMGFQERFEDFEAQLNEWLERANYRPFTPKNLFDVILACASYAYIENCVG